MLVPYRDRAEHLAGFVPFLTRQLERERIDHDLFVIEQAGDAPFNRGKLMNAGFTLTADHGWHCFHDVDLLPIANSDYSRPAAPTALFHATRQDDYVPLDEENINLGGVVLFRPEDFRRINGYSNRFWGWGCEDNDLGRRCAARGLEVTARRVVYEVLPHPSHLDERWYQRNVDYLKRMVDPDEDGLSTLAFDVLEREERDGHHHIRVDIGRPEPD